MKNKSTALYILLMSGVLSISACNDEQNNKAQNVADNISVKIDTAVADVKQGISNVASKVGIALAGNPDSNFVVKAGIDNNKELRLLQSGMDNGSSKELRDHAKMMIADHKKLGDGLKEYAAKKGYILIDGDHGKADEELATLNRKTKGDKWDKEWVDALTSGHKDAIELFENNKDKVKDPELKSMIIGTLPTIRSHYDMMKGMQDKMGK